MTQLNKDRIIGGSFNGGQAYSTMQSGATVTDGKYVYAMRSITSPDDVSIDYVLTFPDWDDMAIGLTPSLEWKSDYKDTEGFHLYNVGFSAEEAVEKMREGKVLFCKTDGLLYYIGVVNSPMAKDKEMVFAFDGQDETMIYHSAKDFIHMNWDKFFNNFYKNESSESNN